jgi:hypothetical protein
VDFVTEKKKLLGKTRRFPIPAGQPHRDRKNDYRRKPKHPKETKAVFGT